MPPPDEQDEYEEPFENGDRNRSVQSESEAPLTPSNDVGYNNNLEEEQKRDEMANLFFTLATQIETSDIRIKQLMSQTITIKQKRYFRLSAPDEEEFIKCLEMINQNLGKAQTMLDTYIELEKSQPEFKNFYNKFYYLFESINTHRASTFYNVNAARDEFLYPLNNFKTKFGGLSFLFARLCGVLNTSGSYMKHVLYLTPRSMPTSPEGYPGGYGAGYGGGYIPHSYPPSIRGLYDDDQFGVGRREPKNVSRDIGDTHDTG